MDDTTGMPPVPQWPEPTMVESSDGVSIATYGPGAAPTSGSAGTTRPVLFAHANGFCAAVYAPLIAELDPGAWVAYDARAHGRSTRGDADMAWEGHRDDALAVVSARELREPLGVGHSMGAAALLLAEQQRPGTFSALWLYEPIVFPGAFSGASENPLEAGALRRRRTFPGRAEAFANFASKPPLSELGTAALAAYVGYGFEAGPEGVSLRCRPEDEAAGYRMGIRHRAWEHLGEVRCPVVVLRGAARDPGPASVAPAIAEALPLGRLEDHPELGHFGPLAAPGTMARSIRSLLGTG